MHKIIFKIITFTVFSLFLTFSAQSDAEALDIKVGLASGTTALHLSSASQITAVDKNGSRTSSSAFNLKASGSVKIIAGNRSMSQPVKFFSKSPLVYNNRKYRGYFMVLNSKGRLTLVNVVELEDYIRGVLKMEVNPDWPVESLKAQAVISRTYALKNRGKHGSEGFDLCDKSHCQVYRGINAEDPVLDKAITSTKGMIIKYGNSIASTFFHSDSGGATADVSKVWSSRIPYLRGKKEPYNYESPYSNWRVSLSPAKIDRAMKKLGYNIGNVTGLNVHETDPFGRANKILVSGSRGQTIVKAHTFRMAVGADHIKSTFFRIGTSMPEKRDIGQKTETISRTSLPAPMLSFVDTSSPKLSPKEEKLVTTLTQQGYFTSREMIDMLLDPSARKRYLLKALDRPQPEKSSSVENNYSRSGSSTTDSNGNFILTGSGWGHGVGLSQWGARNLALKGWNSKKILAHYFPGTRLEKIY